MTAVLVFWQIHLIGKQAVSDEKQTAWTLASKYLENREHRLLSGSFLKMWLVIMMCNILKHKLEDVFPFTEFLGIAS